MHFGSDWHLGHHNIIEYENRPFSSTEEMNEVLIKNINKHVEKNEPFYMLGDIAFGPDAAELISRIHGKKYLIRGNHDGTMLKDPKVVSQFEFIKDYYTLKVNKQKIFLCHYPMISWDSSVHGSYHAFGHIHSRPIPYIAPRAYNVGIDVNNLSPISLEEFLNAADSPFNTL